MAVAVWVDVGRGVSDGVAVFVGGVVAVCDEVGLAVFDAVAVTGTPDV